MTKEQRQMLRLSKQVGQLQGILDWVKTQNVPPEVRNMIGILEKSVTPEPNLTSPVLVK